MNKSMLHKYLLAFVVITFFSLQQEVVGGGTNWFSILQLLLTCST